ncbi:methyltransferase domain-containing protein [Rhodopirellula sp.]|nr:methyltransferase domain-containing protein [Rhodopirellula sp.]
MDSYLAGCEQVIEIGSGAGFSKVFLSNEKIRLTDVVKHDWIDEEVDALNTPYADSSLDAVVSSHMIHHLATPVVFFREMARILKPGGIIVIQEINTSLVMRALLRLMRHEGWSYDVDVFDEKVISNDPRDPWSANCAIPQLLFSNPMEFERNISDFRILRNELCEGMIFPLSGGVISKTKMIQLPEWLLSVVDRFDQISISILPSIFAMGRMVVLEKRDD